MRNVRRPFDMERVKCAHTQSGYIYSRRSKERKEVRKARGARKKANDTYKTDIGKNVYIAARVAYKKKYTVLENDWNHESFNRAENLK